MNCTAAALKIQFYIIKRAAVFIAAGCNAKSDVTAHAVLQHRDKEA